MRFSARLYAVHFYFTGEFEMSFAENFKAARKKCNLTQRELGDLVGLDRSTIAHYETGPSFPLMKNIQKICEVLGVSIEDLLR